MKPCSDGGAASFQLFAEGLPFLTQRDRRARRLVGAAVRPLPGSVAAALLLPDVVVPQGVRVPCWVLRGLPWRVLGAPTFFLCLLREIM